MMMGGALVNGWGRKKVCVDGEDLLEFGEAWGVGEGGSDCLGSLCSDVVVPEAGMVGRE